MSSLLSKLRNNNDLVDYFVCLRSAITMAVVGSLMTILLLMYVFIVPFMLLGVLQVTILERGLDKTKDLLGKIKKGKKC